MGELKNKMHMKMELRNFSKQTIEVYLYHMKKFVAFFGKSPDRLGRSEVEEYLHSLFQRELSASWIILAYSSLKYFYCEVMDKPDIVLKMRRPKSEKKLPVVLSMNEVKKILGHSSLLTTRIYLHIEDSAKSKIINSLDSIMRSQDAD